MRTFLLLATLMASTSLIVNAEIQCAKPTIPVAHKLDSKDVKQPERTADLPSVLDSVNAAIQCYQDNRGSGPDPLPKLSSVVIDFKTTTGLVTGLSFSIFIFKIGGSREKDTVNDLQLTYAAPSPSGKGANKAKPEPLSDALANEILAAANAFQMSNSLQGLPLSKATINVQFGIKFDGNASLSVPISLVTLGPNVDYNKNETQSITLTFGK
jgi:hypothetical protein